jgi:hypothetical protein
MVNTVLKSTLKSSSNVKALQKWNENARRRYKQSWYFLKNRKGAYQSTLEKIGVGLGNITPGFICVLHNDAKLRCSFEICN